MAFSRLIEAIEQGTGKFNNDKQYFIKNSTKEDIIVFWGAKEPEARGAGKYLIKAGEMGGPYPQFLAYHIVKELVSREMQKDGKSKFFGSAEMRAPYEDKFLKEITEGEEDPRVIKIREEERARLIAEMNVVPVVASATNEPKKRGPKKTKPATEETNEEFKGANR